MESGDKTYPVSDMIKTDDRVPLPRYSPKLGTSLLIASNRLYGYQYHPRVPYVMRHNVGSGLG